LYLKSIATSLMNIEHTGATKIMPQTLSKLLHVVKHTTVQARGR